MRPPTLVTVHTVQVEGKEGIENVIMTFSRWRGKWAEGLAALGTARDRAARPDAASLEICPFGASRLFLSSLSSLLSGLDKIHRWLLRTGCGHAVDIQHLDHPPDKVTFPLRYSNH